VAWDRRGHGRGSRGVAGLAWLRRRRGWWRVSGRWVSILEIGDENLTTVMRGASCLQVQAMKLRRYRASNREAKQQSTLESSSP
jgi:hypothetical protein